MPLYYYRAADHSGKVVEGTMEAEAENGVVSRLHDMDCIPLKIGLPGETRRQPMQISFGSLFRKKINQADLLHFTQEVSTLLKAGLPLDRSLGVLANLVEGDEFKRIIRSLLEEVRAGKSLSSTMAQHPEAFPRLYVNMIRAGESGGVLENILHQLAEYLESSMEFKEELKSALTYPVSLAAVSAVSLMVLFVYVIPKFSVIFEDVGDALPWITKVVIQFSNGLSQYGWLVLLMMLVGIVGAVLFIRKPEGKLQWDTFRLNLWLLGDLLRKIEAARFSQTLSALLKGGVPLLDALGTVQGVVGNLLVERAIAKVQTRVKEGKGMVGPLTESGVFPPLALHMIAVGEETGRLEEMLLKVADTFESDVRTELKRVLGLLEPAIILGMGVLVAFIVVAMLLAIFSINEIPL